MSDATKQVAEGYLRRRLSQSLSVRTALCKFFLRNASTKHGIPYDEPAVDDTLEMAALLTPAVQKHEHTVDAGGLVEAINGLATAAARPAPAASPTVSQPQPRPQPAPARPPVVPASAGPGESSPWWRRAAPYVAAATLGAGGLAAYGYLNRPDKPGDQTTIIEQPLSSQYPALQWLEDMEENRP